MWKPSLPQFLTRYLLQQIPGQELRQGWFPHQDESSPLPRAEDQQDVVMRWS